MPTIVSQSVLDEVIDLLNQSCEAGDTVNAIAERSKLDRFMISRLKNRKYTSSPSIEIIETLLNALGHTLSIKRS